MHFDELMCDMCDDLCEYMYMVDCIWNIRVRKHNLRGSGKQTEHDKVY